MKSNLHIRYDNKKSADISVNLMNLSKKYFKYSGDVALKYAGRHIQVSGQAVDVKLFSNFDLDRSFWLVFIQQCRSSNGNW
jgi:hypothetical protein